MGDSGGKGRKRKRQVSWAAAELLEEVKLFHMAKPVNPSVPPPAVDNGEEGDDDAANQPGLALLGLLGVESASPSAASPSPPTRVPVSVTKTLAPSALLQSSASSTAVTSAPVAGNIAPLGEGGGGAGDGGGGGVVVGGVGRASTFFKGFDKTETVVRRRKQASPPPPPPPGSPPDALSPSGEGAHSIHRYPKDIWPGHKPPNHTDIPAGQGKGEATGATKELLEFFCDGCDETIPGGTERMECAVCPDEFCLCHACYDEGEVLDKRHEHELLSSAAPFHVTRAAPSAEAAAAAAKALHVTEELDEAYNHDDLG